MIIPSPYPPAADLERHSKNKAKFITIPPDDPNLVARQQGRLRKILDDVGPAREAIVANMKVERYTGRSTVHSPMNQDGYRSPTRRSEEEQYGVNMASRTDRYLILACRY